MATKGSQKWIQILVNQKTDFLNNQIKTSLSLPVNEEIHWRSPLAIDNYIEYKDEGFLDALGIQHLKSKFADFWPTSGPRWYFGPHHAFWLEVGALAGFALSALIWLIVAVATPAPMAVVDAAKLGARRVHDRLPPEIRERLPEEIRVKLTGS